jgi:hypothetical protein
VRSTGEIMPNDDQPADRRPTDTAWLPDVARKDQQDFKELIDMVRAAVVEYHRRRITDTGATTSAADDLQQALTLFRQVIDKETSEVPLPSAVQELVEATVKNFQLLIGGLQGRQAIPLDTQLDVTVHYLLSRNVAVLKSVIGADAVRKDLLNVVHQLAGKPRGRPTSVSVETLRQAKRLRLQGLSHGRIANKLGFSRQQVVTMLKHHFPEKKSK